MAIHLTTIWPWPNRDHIVATSWPHRGQIQFDHGEYGHQFDHDLTMAEALPHSLNYRWPNVGGACHRRLPAEGASRKGDCMPRWQGWEIFTLENFLRKSFRHISKRLFSHEGAWKNVYPPPPGAGQAGPKTLPNGGFGLAQRGVQKGAIM